MAGLLTDERLLLQGGALGPALVAISQQMVGFQAVLDSLRLPPPPPVVVPPIVVAVAPFIITLPAIVDSTEAIAPFIITPPSIV